MISCNKLLDYITRHSYLKLFIKSLHNHMIHGIPDYKFSTKEMAETIIWNMYGEYHKEGATKYLELNAKIITLDAKEYLESVVVDTS